MMRTEADKAIVELSVFREFIAASKLSIDPASVRKGNPDQGEPDILCTLDGQPVAFELAEACAPEFAAAASLAMKLDSGVATAWGEDVTHLTLRNKLTKRYRVACGVQLLIYTNGLTAMPDDLILARLEPEFASGFGSFNTVWLFGESVHRVSPP